MPVPLHMPSHPVAAIIPSQEELQEMGRRRYQKPSVLRTDRRKNGTQVANPPKQPQWYVRYVADQRDEMGAVDRNEQPPKYLGYCTGPDSITKREAEKLRDQFLETINEPRIVIPAQMLMSQVFDRYKLIELPLMKPTTLRNYTYCIDNQLTPEFGRLQLCRIDVDRVQEWLNKMMGLAPNTRSFRLRVLSSVMEFAAKRKWTRERNPAKDARIGDVGGRRWDRRALTAEEVRRLLIAADNFMDGMIGQVIRIGVFCGLCIAEILALRWNDYKPPELRVDENRNQEGAWSRPKTENRVRTVPTGPIALVRPAGAQDKDRIFPLEYDAVRYRLLTLFKQVNISGAGLGTHTFRRTHATLMKAAGVRLLAEQLGHATEKMSNHYVREDFVTHEKAVNRLAEWIGGPVQ